MLSRTADHLYWMSRYIERAESLARLVDAHYRMSLLPHAGATLAQSLSSTMTALHMEQAYKEKHDAIEPDAVFEFVSLDRDYSRSIYSCLLIAPEDARAALPAAVLQGGLPEPEVGGERPVGGDRAPRRRNACHAALHAHGRNHRDRPAAFSRAVPGSLARSRRSHCFGFPAAPGGGVSV